MSQSARRVVVLALLMAAVCAALLLSMAVGSRTIPFGDVLSAVFGGADSDNATVITSQRLPRTLLGLLAGAALGAAGALMQGHTRNPLADPGLFGVNAGATLAVTLVVFGLGVSAPMVLVVAALIGAAVASSAVMVVGLRASGRSTLVLMALVGSAVSAVLLAMSTSVILLDNQTLDVVRFWQVGSIEGRDAAMLPVVAIVIVVGLLLAVHSAFSLNSLTMGDDVAMSLGVDVRRARLMGVVAITLLCGSATAACGPIGFLGLLAPHLARRLVGTDYRWVVPASAAVGVVVLLTGDVLGRVLVRPGELQVGIMVAAAGGPALLAIARRKRLAAL